MKQKFLTPRSAQRVVDYPEFGSGVWDLVSGRRTPGGKYARSPWAFACMQIRGTELANLPWRLMRDDEVVKDHPIIDMLTKFGKESNYASAVEATEIDLLRTGCGFWLHDIDILERLNAGTIRAETTSSGIKEFVQTIKGQIVNRFDREEVVYFREYHPDSDIEEGTAVMEVIKLAIAQEYESSKYVEAFFKNDATPSLLLHTEQTVAEPEMNKVLAWWNKRFRGARRGHKVAMADRGLKAQILSTSMKDIALVEIRDQARGDICTGFRVPKILVGSMEDATYANAQEARKFMIEDLIIPRSVYYAGVINQDLVQRIDPSVTFEFETDTLPILQESATTKWTRLNSAVERGAISLAYARQQMGWPESAAPQPVDEINPVLRSWKRKATKAFKRGESADVDFVTDEIPVPEQLKIRARLSQVDSIDGVLRAFTDD